MKWIFPLLLLFVCCKKTDDNGYTVYKIKKGEHRSVYSYNRLSENTYYLECIFDESAIYTSIDPNNQYDINKLWGLSDCNKHHMKNSIRFGWRWLNDSLEIHWFKHEESKFTHEKIACIDLNKKVFLSLNITEDEYQLSVNGKTGSTPRACSKDYNKYKLYPYFGGDEVAPHDITIKIKEYYK